MYIRNVKALRSSINGFTDDNQIATTILKCLAKKLDEMKIADKYPHFDLMTDNGTARGTRFNDCRIKGFKRK